jgi:hypothetical protein
MATDEREPDHTDAGTGRDVGEGYPEEQPGSGSPHEQSADKGGTGPASDRAPESDPDRDSDAGKATGNPDAAG